MLGRREKSIATKEEEMKVVKILKEPGVKNFSYLIVCDKENKPLKVKGITYRKGFDFIEVETVDGEVILVPQDEAEASVIKIVE
jgi:hypothetical protein